MDEYDGVRTPVEDFLIHMGVKVKPCTFLWSYFCSTSQIIIREYSLAFDFQEVYLLSHFALFMDMNKLQLRFEERIDWVEKIIDFVAPKYDEIIKNLNSKGSQINVDMWNFCEGDFPSTRIPQITQSLRLNTNGNWFNLIRNLQDDSNMEAFWKSISNNLGDDWSNSGFPSTIWQYIGDLKWELETFPKTYISHKLFEGILDGDLKSSLDEILDSEIEKPTRYKMVNGKQKEIADIGGAYSVFKLSQILSKINISLPDNFSELCHKMINDLDTTEETCNLRYKSGFGQYSSTKTTYAEIKDGIVTLVKSRVLREIKLNQVEKLLDS